MSVQGYYEAYWKESGYADRRSLSPSVAAVMERHTGPARRCLDIGCGDGALAGGWIGQDVGSYIGVDVSRAAVDAARGRGLDARVIDDAAALPFEDGSFELAVSFDVLEHLFDPETAVREAHRVLRPGGHFVATVPNVAHWRTRADLALLGRWAGRGDPRSAAAPWLDPHIRFFTPKSFTRLFELVDFELVESGGFSHHGLLQSVPGLRRLARSEAPGPFTTLLSRRLPGLFASGLFAVGVRRS